MKYKGGGGMCWHDRYTFHENDVFVQNLLGLKLLM